MKKLYRKALALVLIPVMLLAGSACTRTEVDYTNCDSEDLEGALGVRIGSNWADESVNAGIERLGLGYDIINASLFNESDLNLNARILDVPALAEAGYVYYRKESEVTTSLFVSQGAKDLYSAMAAQFNTISEIAFTGMISEFTNRNTSASAEGRIYKDTYFVLSDCLISLKRFYINTGDISVLSEYITDQFAEDLENLSARELLDKYGAYIMMDIDLGGRYSFLYDFADPEEIASVDDLEEGATDTLENAGVLEESVQADVSVPVEDNSGFVELVENCCDLYVIVNGGRTRVNTSTYEKALESFADWKASVNANNAEFVNCGGGCYIWEIAGCIDSSKARALRNCFFGIEEDLSGDLEV